jgi:hypothetical protein
MWPRKSIEVSKEKRTFNKGSDTIENNNFYHALKFKMNFVDSI